MISNAAKDLAVPDFTRPHARSAHVSLGRKCSYKCGFCYYRHSRSSDNFRSPAQVIEYLDFLKRYGIYNIQFTGGEPLEYPREDLLKILSYAKMRFNMVSIITNGSNPGFLKELFPYVTTVLFSLHGANKKTHDAITGVEGSWEKIQESIDLVIKYNKRYSLNCTINHLNYREISQWTNNIIFSQKEYPMTVNFLPLNSWEEAPGLGIQYSEYADDLTLAVICLTKCGIETKVRYVPFCAFPAIAPYILGHSQHVYDYNDWNQELDGENPNGLYLMEGYGYFTTDAIQKKREKMYFKDIKCIQCVLNPICDGFHNGWKEHEKYVANMGEILTKQHWKVSELAIRPIKDPLALSLNLL